MPHSTRMPAVPVADQMAFRSPEGYVSRPPSGRCRPGRSACRWPPAPARRRPARQRLRPARWLVA
eukprot:2865597-Prymnesium_polylepis.3